MPLSLMPTFKDTEDKTFHVKDYLEDIFNVQVQMEKLSPSKNILFILNVINQQKLIHTNLNILILKDLKKSIKKYLVNGWRKKPIKEILKQRKAHYLKIQNRSHKKNPEKPHQVQKNHPKPKKY